MLRKPSGSGERRVSSAYNIRNLCAQGRKNPYRKPLALQIGGWAWANNPTPVKKILLRKPQKGPYAPLGTIRINDDDE